MRKEAAPPRLIAASMERAPSATGTGSSAPSSPARPKLASANRRWKTASAAASAAPDAKKIRSLTPVSSRPLVPTEHQREIRALFRTAMAVFVVTVVIGILNGLDAIEFDRATLLTHVHSGTLGWITLSVLAATLWIFGGAFPPSAARPIAWLAIASVPVYVLAFFSGQNAFKAIAGAGVLAFIASTFVVTLVAVRRTPLTVARLAVVVAFGTLAVGSTIGVLIQLQYALVRQFLPAGAIGGHVSAQVVGYLVLMGMAITEWRLRPDAVGVSRGALAQIALLFIGSLLVTVGALLDVQPLLGAFIPLEMAALAIFLVRLGPRAFRSRWLALDSERQFGIMVPYLIANVTLLVWLVAGVVTGRYSDFALIPPWLIFAFDHAMFIGVMTNGLFGLLYDLTRERAETWAWVGHLTFWGTNIGLLGFVLGLLFEVTLLKQVFTPIMGSSILLSLLTFAVRSQSAARPALASRPA